MTGVPRSCVLLADRHLGLAEGIRGLLEASFGTVVMVSDASSLAEAAGRLQPDVVVVDLSLAHGHDLAWLRGISARAPGSKIIALSVHDERSVREAVLATGVDAFVLKREISTELLKAVSRVRGEDTGRDPLE